MARGSKRYKGGSPWWSWVSFLVFGFLIALFGTSIWQRKSPAKVIKTWFTSPPSEDPILRMGKSELRQYAQEQTMTIDSLRQVLEGCLEKTRKNTAIINTQTASLNMRSAPSLSSDIMMKIPNKSRVTILYYDQEEYVLDGATGSWCRISYAQQEGWVWGNYLMTE